MNPDELDWEYLLQDTFWPGVSLLAAVILLVAGSWYHERQQQFHDTYSLNQEAIHEDYDELVYRRRLLERYHRRYNEFRRLGFVGRESRLDWIETIRSAAKGLDLPNVSYSLEPQRPVSSPLAPSSADAEIQVYLSRIDIDFGLVHELDLLRFFDRLELQAPGLMKVDSCNLSRQAQADQQLIAEANITASCSLMIFSVITSDIGAGKAEI